MRDFRILRVVLVVLLTFGHRSGLVLCALAEHFFPQEVEWTALSFDNTREGNMSNCTKAFSVFEKGRVPALLEPEDLVDSEVAEARSLQTYISGRNRLTYCVFRCLVCD